MIISELPPTSVSMMGDMLRLYYFVYIHRSLYHPQQSANLQHISFVWERKNIVYPHLQSFANAYLLNMQ